MRQDVDVIRRDEDTSRKRIKFAGFVGAGVLLLLLGFNVPTYAQRDQQGQDDKAQKQEQAQPQQHAQQQQDQERQQQQRGQQQQQDQAKQQQQHAQQQQDQAKQQQQQRGQQQQRAQQQQRDQARQQQQRGQQQQQDQARQQQQRGQQQQRAQEQRPRPVGQPSQQGQRVQQAEERGVWQQHRAVSWQSEHRTWQQRGGYDGYRIPDDRFRGYFGVGHAFRIYSQPLVIFGGYPSFQFGGFWFSILDPWPEYWAADWYNSDDVYIDYSADGYYLYNRRYPQDRIAVEAYGNYSQLSITRALYGTGKHIVDVTAQLNAQIRDGQLSIPVTNAFMGGDPYPNRVKTLQVWYAFVGRAGQVTLNENDYLQLPPGS